MEEKAQVFEAITEKTLDGVSMSAAEILPFHRSSPSPEDLKLDRVRIAIQAVEAGALVADASVVSWIRDQLGIPKE